MTRQPLYASCITLHIMHNASWFNMQVINPEIASHSQWYVRILFGYFSLYIVSLLYSNDLVDVIQGNKKYPSDDIVLEFIVISATLSHIHMMNHLARKH